MYQIILFPDEIQPTETILPSLIVKVDSQEPFIPSSTIFSICNFSGGDGERLQSTNKMIY
jgi:hypothetical protein